MPPAEAPDPARTALVFAHPDDEVLWASALLARAARVLIVFGDLPGNARLSEGRRRAMADFPLPGVEHLGLVEAGVFDTAAWPLPAETPEGLALVRRPRRRPGFSPARYRENHARLAELLAERLRGVADVVTHNPWGEYGHEEHVQVLRAVAAAQARAGFRIWVTGYVSDKSEPLMRRHLLRLGPASPPMPTDPALGARLREHYRAHDCWTWDAGYVWPATEVFYPWPAAPASGGATGGPRLPAYPMTYIRLGFAPRRRGPRALLARLLRPVLRRG